MLEISFVQDEGRVFDLRQFEHQFIVLVEEFDRIAPPAGFWQRHMDIPISARIYISGNFVNLYGHKWFDQKGISIDKNQRISGPVEHGIAEGLYLSPGNAADGAVTSADIDGRGESDIRDLRSAMGAGHAFDCRRLVGSGWVDKDDAGLDRSGQDFLCGLVFTGDDLTFVGDGLGAVRRSEQVLAIFEDYKEPVIEVGVRGFAVDGAVLR